MADVLRLCDLPGDFGECFLPYRATLRQRVQAKKYSNESYVNFVKLFRGDSSIHLKAGVFRSQRKSEEPHRVTLEIGEQTILEAHCTCKAGVSGECAHVLAVIYKTTDWILEGLSDVPSQPACTSVAQQWDKPRGAGKIVAEPVSQMVIARPGNDNRKKRPLTCDFDDNRKVQLLSTDIDYLQSLTGSPISYLASQPDQTVMTDHGSQNVGSALAHQLPLLQPAVPSGESCPCADVNFPQTPELTQIPIVPGAKLEKVKIDAEDAKTLETNTQEQADSQLWYSERAKRITASNLGRFMLRKSAVTGKFVDSVIKVKPFKSAATSYGKSNEKVAVNLYRQKTKNHVHPCGLFVNPAYPYIAATPDGKVCDGNASGILEVKCPFSIRDMTVVEALSDTKIAAKLAIEKDGENIVMKKNHAYWFQVQGQLLVTGAAFCDFVVYTRQDFQVLRVKPNKAAMDGILTKLCGVYTEFF